MMSGSLIIAVAPCGATARKEQNPAVPYSAAEIAAEIVAAAEAGAALAHVHARAEDGSPTQDVAVFREIIDRVREHSDIILELSLGTRSFSLEQALEPLTLAPAMASFPMVARRNSEAGGDSLAEAARLMLDSGTRPAYAITSANTGAEVLRLIGRGLAGTVPCVYVAADANGGSADVVGRLVGLIEHLPETAQWWVMKSGATPAAQYAVRGVAIAAGAHVRVGFEDTLRTYDDSGLAPTNAWFVERMVALAKEMGRPVATPREAREILRL